MTNPTGKGGFVKGDPRINRKGRPRSFKELRDLARQIAEEKAVVKGNTLVVDGHAVTVVEADKYPPFILILNNFLVKYIYAQILS